ncbi:PREDICTED: AP-4 complex subunit mu-like [Priapulus caudatus]|uniref:AP-4 complex subunit mu-like n=1 Tax=Priapulus caudatus TaxID=37621 RepID=A0ABM1DSR2_PRICU|nr:PREDICTED: AP-4 complex subunit mu-like [Priapulus caudatus]
MLQYLCILNGRGELLLLKHYRGAVPVKVTETFFEHLHTGSGAPRFEKDGNVYQYVKKGDLYFACSVEKDVSPFLITEFLQRLFYLCKDFCGDVSEGALLKNFVLIHEMLDEVVDGGIIQQTATEKIRPFIYSEPAPIYKDCVAQTGLFGVERRIAPGSAANKPVIPSQADLELRRNEVFIDVVEKMTALFGSDGNVLRSEVSGQIQLKSFLAGSCVIQMALSDNIVIGNDRHAPGYGSTTLEGCKFHDCVKKADAGNNYLINPPQGEFSVLTYQIGGEVGHTLPFRLQTVVEDYDVSRDMEVILKLRCDIPARTKAVNISLTIPVPKETSGMSHQLGLSGQTAEFQPKEKQILWKVNSMMGETSHIAQFKLFLTTRTKAQRMEIGPAVLTFEVSNYVPSQLRVAQVLVLNGSHSFTPYRWVRYVTLSDSYTFRV